MSDKKRIREVRRVDEISQTPGDYWMWESEEMNGALQLALCCPGCGELRVMLPRWRIIELDPLTLAPALLCHPGQGCHYRIVSGKVLWADEMHGIERVRAGFAAKAMALCVLLLACCFAARAQVGYSCYVLQTSDNGGMSWHDAPLGATATDKDVLVRVAMRPCAPLEEVPAPVAHSSASHCGKERWAVKTLAAGPYASEPGQGATVSDLSKLMAPTREMLNHAPASRFPAERVVYQLDVLLVGYKKEADQDYHLVLADRPVPLPPCAPGNDCQTHPRVTMIAEIPAPDCAPQQYAKQFGALRAFIDSNVGKATAKYKRLEKPVRVGISGVGFFDFIHGQTGVAPNGFELHPVLRIVIAPVISSVTVSEAQEPRP